MVVRAWDLIGRARWIPQGQWSNQNSAVPTTAPVFQGEWLPYKLLTVPLLHQKIRFLSHSVFTLAHARDSACVIAS